MPVIPGGVVGIATRALSLTFKDYTGAEQAVNGQFPDDATDVQFIAIQNASGNVSNAVPYARRITQRNEVNPLNPLIEYYDEALPTVAAVAVFVYQNNAGETFNWEVPAPDASIFVPESPTVINTANAQVQALNTAILAALNAGTPAGTYAYVRGFLSQRARRARRIPSIPAPGQVVEPGVGDLPPDAPGVGD